MLSGISLTTAFLVSALIVMSGCESSSSKTGGSSDSNNTLATISNAGYAMNAYGYYGAGVQFGNDHIVGFWDTYPPSGYADDFKDNGDVYIGNDFGVLTPEIYGVSEDGLNLYISLYGDNAITMTSGSGSCYDVVRGEASYVYCKYPQNAYGFYGPLVYFGNSTTLVGTWNIEILEGESELPDAIIFGEDGNATLVDQDIVEPQLFPYGAGNTIGSQIFLAIYGEKDISLLGDLDGCNMVNFNSKVYRFCKHEE